MIWYKLCSISFLARVLETVLNYFILCHKHRSTSTAGAILRYVNVKVFNSTQFFGSSYSVLFPPPAPFPHDSSISNGSMLVQKIAHNIDWNRTGYGNASVPLEDAQRQLYLDTFSFHASEGSYSKGHIHVSLPDLAAGQGILLQGGALNCSRKTLAGSQWKFNVLRITLLFDHDSSPSAATGDVCMWHVPHDLFSTTIKFADKIFCPFSCS